MAEPFTNESSDEKGKFGEHGFLDQREKAKPYRETKQDRIRKFYSPSETHQYPEGKPATSDPSTTVGRLCVVCLERPAMACFLCCCTGAPCLCLQCEAASNSCPSCGRHYTQR